MQNRRYGLLGFPLKHSFSKTYFESKFLREKIRKCSYENFELPKIEDLKLLLQEVNLMGFNVTIPYKKLIIPYLHSLEPMAEKVGAVNCVKRVDSNWIGFNTDVIGFGNSLKPLLQSHHTHALVLGTGGASKAVCFVLEQLGIEFLNVSRQERQDCISYNDLNYEVINAYKIIINTTPIGTFPEEDVSPPLPYEYLSPSHLCYDLIYNPAESLFLKNSSAMGAETKNGLEMLEMQAEESWRIWNTN
ncbi:MAG: shikimate dehydrogenase [Bacteroidetes bacterium]|nr:shikimate dehydrogenase [Bacteroidota bacterium]